MKQRSRIFNGPKGQHGAATLIVSIVILTMITFVTLHTSKTILTEQKIANNDTNSRIAFEAAEAGISTAIAYYAEDADRNNDDIIDGTADLDSSGTIGDANGEGVIDSSADVDTIGETLKAVVGDSESGGYFSLVITDENGDGVTLRITSTGYSADRSATRTVTRIIQRIPPLAQVPDNPITTKANIDILGSVQVYNPEGHSTIWSGKDTKLGINATTKTYVANVADSNYPGCMDVSVTAHTAGTPSCSTAETSDNSKQGLDVISNDASLSGLTDDEFFRNFFGMSKLAYKTNVASRVVTGANANTELSGATGEIIWVDGNATLQGITTGCTVSLNSTQFCKRDAGSLKSNIIIIDGNLTLSGSPHMYGVVFVTGTITGTGTPKIVGALVSSGAAEPNGTVRVWYDSDVIRNTYESPPFGSASGSWSDL